MGFPARLSRGERSEVKFKGRLAQTNKRAELDEVGVRESQRESERVRESREKRREESESRGEESVCQRVARVLPV